VDCETNGEDPLATGRTGGALETSEDGQEKQGTAPTLLELELKAQRAFRVLHDAGWDWAVVITEIHDSKLYPASEDVGGWEAYMLTRWGLHKAQAYRIVAWVHH
jgi:hypothetical protein